MNWLSQGGGEEIGLFTPPQGVYALSRSLSGLKGDPQAVSVNVLACPRCLRVTVCVPGAALGT